VIGSIRINPPSGANRPRAVWCSAMTKERMMEKQRQAMQGIDTALENITELPPKEYVQWISYLLEAIEEEFGVDMLREVSQIISRRLEWGGW